MPKFVAETCASKQNAIFGEIIVRTHWPMIWKLPRRNEPSIYCSYQYQCVHHLECKIVSKYIVENTTKLPAEIRWEGFHAFDMQGDLCITTTHDWNTTKIHIHFSSFFIWWRIYPQSYCACPQIFSSDTVVVANVLLFIAFIAFF